ncbi:O-antigen ligase family protein [Demequina sp. SYSU T00068]|uniref:O-antigen ligase family protein n=1 Tax=Demequina lignilytica TaxID=3051663 RepID=UPI00262E2EEA|nr:O-antigen ligase family protein [Demequina sp. SYSU T00068]MDN4490658.1 O-antigen ligase family protein [Demequina sp. SYSU T00068]
MSANEVVFTRALPMAVIGGVSTVAAILRGGVRLGHGAVPLLLLFATFGVFAATGQSPLMPLVSLATLLPAIIVPARGFSLDALRAGARTGVGSVVIAVPVVYAWKPTDVIGACRLDKCSAWGLALGAEGTGNALGMYLAGAGALSLLLVTGALTRLAVLASALVLVDLTASRSALISFVVAAGVVLLGQVLAAKFPSKPWAQLGLAFSAVAVAVLPLTTNDPASYTGRAELWIYARELFWQSPLAGYGPSFWVGGNGSDGIDRNYSTHNLFTELLVSGGVLAVLSFAAAVVLAVRGPRTQVGSAHVAATASIVMLISLSEVTSGPGRIYLAPCFLAYLFMAAQTTQTPSTGRGAPEECPPQSRGKYRRVGPLSRTSSRRRLAEVPGQLDGAATPTRRMG